jgi:hypothetical protein
MRKVFIVGIIGLAIVMATTCIKEQTENINIAMLKYSKEKLQPAELALVGFTCPTISIKSLDTAYCLQSNLDGDNKYFLIINNKGIFQEATIISKVGESRTADPKSIDAKMVMDYFNKQIEIFSNQFQNAKKISDLFNQKWILKIITPPGSIEIYSTKINGVNITINQTADKATFKFGPYTLETNSGVNKIIGFSDGLISCSKNLCTIIGERKPLCDLTDKDVRDIDQAFAVIKSQLTTRLVRKK